MGAAASVSGIRRDWRDVFNAMKFKNSEVKKLFELFNIVDSDHGGTIDVVELLTLLDIERTAFAERIFAAFDKDRTGKIDFYEFVVSLWKFCTLGDGAINVFAFDIYDSDADGKLTVEQVQKLFREMFGSKVMENDAVKAGLAELLKHALDKHVDIDVFRVYSKTHQALLYPVFAIQEKLKKSTLGSMVWENISQRRIQLHKGRTLPIRELMVLHSDRKQFHGLLEDKTVLRVSSMMRIVLDNTDTATHYKPVSCEPESVPAHHHHNHHHVATVPGSLHGAVPSAVPSAASSAAPGVAPGAAPGAPAASPTSIAGRKGSTSSRKGVPHSDKFVPVQDLHITGPVHKVVRLSTKLNPRKTI